MFKKEENNTVSASKNHTPSLTMISEGTSLNGTINTENDIRIAGKTNGELNTKGKLIVTSSGVVEGDIHVTDADIAGKIEGELRVSNKLTLRQSAVIEGDIYTKTLIVEEGAEMVGACRMGADAAKAPSLTNSPKTNDASSSFSKSEKADESSKNGSANQVKKANTNGKYIKA
jgi:cytoskeletal protein CcmA (bactofilin family)